MKHIKNSFALFKQDWRRIFKNPIAIGLMMALIVIPSLYAWFNIKALWDPYANTSSLPSAVYSDDKSAVFNGKKIDVGDQVIENLHKNKQLGWRFVDSKKDLIKGVKSGKYYAGIYLPEDFTEDLLSFASGTIDKPDIDYYFNEKINAIAPKITEKGATAIQTQVTQEFIKTATSTLLSGANQLGLTLGNNENKIIKVKDLILEADDNMSTINSYLAQVQDLNAKMPELQAKLKTVEDYEKYLPEIEQMANQAVKLNDMMPEIKDKAALILTVQSKIPEIEAAASQLQNINDNFDKITQTMSDGLATAQKGLDIVNQVDAILPDAQKLADQAGDFAKSASDGASQLQDAVPSIASSVKTTIDSIAMVADTASSMVSQLQGLIADGAISDSDRQIIKNATSRFSDNLGKQITAIDGLTGFLNSLNTSHENAVLTTVISQLQTIKDRIVNLKTIVDHVTTIADTITVAQLEEFLGQVGTAVDNISGLLSAINVASIQNTVQDLLNQLITTLGTAQSALTQAQAIDFKGLVSSAQTTLTNVINLIETYQGQLPALKQELSDANDLLNGHLTDIINGINKAADFYNNDLPTLASKLQTAVDFYQNDWPTTKAELENGLKVANEKLPQAASALSFASNLISTKWPKIEQGIHLAAQKIRETDKEISFAEILRLLNLDPTSESDFFTSPVDLKTTALYPIANNGSASTPFYTALALWVGAVLFASVSTTSVFLEKKDRGLYSERDQFAGRMLTYLSVSFMQALVVTLGNIFLLGVDVHEAVLSVVFALLIALAFSMLVYVLVALFGTVGKGLAVIILVLSISGGGGNYPIQVSSHFFQMINPLLPFTYAVNLLRESAGGVYWPNAWRDITVLVSIFVVSGLLGTAFYPKVSKLTEKLTKVANETHLFH
jgi:putative membrane protein